MAVEAAAAANSAHIRRKSIGGRPFKSSPDLTLLLENLSKEARIEPARLRLSGPLGEGAYASVRRAELRAGASLPGGEADTRQVAVKFLHQQLLEDAEQVQLFVQEVELLRTLRHRWASGTRVCRRYSLAPLRQ